MVPPKSLFSIRFSVLWLFVGLLGCRGSAPEAASGEPCPAGGTAVCPVDASEAVVDGGTGPGAGGMDGGAFVSRSVNSGKLDLLFMIDNSGGMRNKQEVLRLALPELLQRLVQPDCIDSNGVVGEPANPSTNQCAPGFTRPFAPVEDIHVAVITSSLGDAGASLTCPAGGDDGLADMAHAVGSLPRAAQGLSGGNDLGFLQWRPASVLGQFATHLTDMVGVVGEQGCGWENSLESWYRFLIDPYPYRALTRTECNEGDTSALCVRPSTTATGEPELDEVLLAQRAEFLRPDSHLVIAMLTDENDCSLRIDNTSWVVASNRVSMYRSTSACETNPNDKCCHSCVVASPDGCTADPVCDAEPTTGPGQGLLSASEDALNLRCFQQKRRFGLDALYPTSRYVNALSQPKLCASAPDLRVDDCDEPSLIDNPLFPVGGRPVGERVYLQGIVGVPHQAIASTVDSQGRALSDPSRQLRFKSWRELTEENIWSQIVGEAGTAYVPSTQGRPEIPGTSPVAPTSPYMVESAYERLGVANGNAINGRDRDTTGVVAPNGGTPPRSDLQYACIFPLATARDCLTEERSSCDCTEGFNDKPLCEELPGISPPGSVQYWDRAYPGTRHLEVLRDLGANAIVASVCARNVDDPSREDFGYRPAMAALLERLGPQLPSATP